MSSTQLCRCLSRSAPPSTSRSLPYLYRSFQTTAPSLDAPPTSVSKRSASSPRVRSPNAGRHPSERPPPQHPVDISLFSPLLDPHPEASGPSGRWAIHFPFDPPLPINQDYLRSSRSQSLGASAIVESLPEHTLSEREISQKLHRYALVVKRVVNQTGMGKIPSIYVMVVVGDGKGMVGYGEGKATQAVQASQKAFAAAVKNMAPVNLYEGRTIHTELRGKFHATEIVMRPRPAGFGLKCNPNLHQFCKAAGIEDISAKVTRSTNPMNVIKLAAKMLHSGSAPIAMGDGFGGRGKRLEKGVGMRTLDELALMRGRRPQEFEL